ncbi:MAG: hypothetical protein JWS12_476, partial [Candidatus Saccharibacteria bacterium]|nr:hypothetical protein [Candidatus Saccharibacteria bacterium]
MAKETKEQVKSVRYRTRWLSIFGLVILLVSGWFWWTKVYTSPRNVFLGMLSSSLSTPSVTRHLTEKASGSTQNQYTQINFGGQTFVHVLNTNQQVGQTGQNNSIKTETIGTLRQDFARYVAIESSQKNQAGKPLNYASVQQVWGKSEVAKNGQATSTRFLEQATLGIVPLG